MSAAGERPTKAYSCIRCFERKVKCDKQSPCSNCVKSNVECIFRVPPAPRRRKKRPPEEMLLARLKKCEELLQKMGVDIDSSNTPISPAAPTDPPASAGQFSPDATATGSEFFVPPSHKTGQLIVDHGKSRFIENNLWTSVSTEFQAKEAITEYSEDDDEAGSGIEDTSEFMLGYTPSNNTIQQLHPSPDQIFLLWQIFLENINPMTKFVHQPTFQETLVQASANLDNLPKGLEALMFSIYSAAVFSMEDDECEIKLGESRKALLARYRHATRKALARARFMGTSDIMVLQAFVLYIITMREAYDSRTTWTLAGVASRVAQGMGLHRDGTHLGVSAFETEMRRRLWWQISILDFRSAELSGSGRFADFHLSDTQPPSNVNDADIHPDMTSAPVPHTRPTEMIACLLRCEFGQFWKEKVLNRSSISTENFRLASPFNTSLETRDANINELEQRLEERFLRYCDPSIPVQFMAIIIGRAAINSMRLMARHPRKYRNSEDLPASERDYMFRLSIKLLEADNLAHASKGLRRFMWHTNVYFVWQALVYLLDELRTRTLGDEVDRAWQQVDEVFLHHANFVTDNKKPLHVAVGSLCLKAYSAREAALRESTNGVYPKVVPEYIRTLREQRKNQPLRPPPPQTETASLPLAGPGTFTSMLSAGPSDTDPNGNKYNTSGAYPQNTAATPSSSTIPYDTQSSSQAALQSAARTQLPLPPFQSVQMFHSPSNDLMFASDPTVAQDLAMADMPLDWAQWDYIMNDFEQGK
ncbi:Aurofusarin cluster transcription factor aurR2 [Exophiala dermatitidis]